MPSLGVVEVKSLRVGRFEVQRQAFPLLGGDELVPLPGLDLAVPRVLQPVPPACVGLGGWVSLCR